MSITPPAARAGKHDNLVHGENDVEVNLDDFRRHFELLSDEALLETNREDLVESAKQCFDEEMARRGLNAAPVEEAEEQVAGRPELDPSDELVVIATYHIPEEASLARGLLESAEIPYHLDNEYVALGGFEMRLRVPRRYQEEAVEILEMEISDEELAAQAEAAGMPDDEEYAEEGQDMEEDEARPEEA